MAYIPYAIYPMATATRTCQERWSDEEITSRRCRILAPDGSPGLILAGREVSSVSGFRGNRQQVRGQIRVGSGD